MERTRIGHVIGHLAHGRAQRQLYDSIRGLDPKRFQCIVSCLSKLAAPYADMVRHEGVGVHVFERQRPFN